MESLKRSKAALDSISLFKKILLKDRSLILPSVRKETVVIDYSSPNIAKPFHLGHFRATVVGNFVCNINQLIGHNVIGINYLGDWGTQFNILASGFAKYGNEIELTNDPIKHLHKVYVAANQDREILSNVSQDNRNENSSKPDLSIENNPDLLNLWQKFRSITCEHLKQTYARMNIEFSRLEYESDYVRPAQSLVQTLLGQGLAICDEDGVICLNPDEKSSIPKRIILLKSDGSTLYLTRDVAAAIARYERYKFDRIHYVVEDGQRLHFKQVQEVLTRMGHNWANMNPESNLSEPSGESSLRNFHIPFGRVMGMSTRKGEGLFLSDILDNARQAVLWRMNQSPNTRVRSKSPNDSTNSLLNLTDWTNRNSVADHLGVTCLVSAMVHKPRTKPLQLQSFLGYPMTSVEQSNLTSNSHELAGLGIQYCHARLCSLESRVYDAQIIRQPVDSQDFDSEFWTDILDRSNFQASAVCKHQALMDHIAKFPTTFYSAYLHYEPSIILHYAVQLTSLVNRAWSHLPVISCENREEQLARFTLFMVSKTIIADCLDVLGLKPLEAI